MNTTIYNTIRHYQETYQTISSRDVLETIIFNFRCDLAYEDPFLVEEGEEFLINSIWSPYHV